MEVCIINSSLRAENTTRIVSDACANALTKKNIPVSVLTLEPFNEMFTGTYIYLTDASKAQITELEKMKRATVLLFVVPTYYRAMPGALKNFFDLVRSPEVYENKTIAFVSSNHKNQDYGAQQTFSVVQALLIFFKIRAVLVPTILIQNPVSVFDSEVAEFMDMMCSFTSQAT